MVHINLNTISNLKHSDFRPSKSSIKNLFLLLRGDLLIPFQGDVTFEDPEGAKKPFATHYEQHIKPNVIKFETKRIDALWEFRKRIMITIPALIAIFMATLAGLWMLGMKSEGHDIVLFIGFAACAGVLAWCHSPVRKYKSSVKGQIFPMVFKFFGDDYKYSESGLLSLESLEKSEVIPHYTSSHTEDYVKGTYKGVTLELTEAKLTKTSGSGKNRRTVTVFKGMMILFSVNKKFQGKTLIKRDAGMLGNWLSGKFSKYEQVKLEDPVFEKKFEVYSSDQVEARYLLTTSFMQRLLDLSDVFHSNKIQCSFYDNQLLLMLPSPKNFFETESIYEPATFVNDINTVLKEMRIIFQIIDILKLDQKTGL